MDDTPLRSRNDPTPEKRKGDSSFLPVVIAAAVVLLVLFVVFLIFIRGRNEKIVPGRANPRSSLVLPYMPRTHVSPPNWS